VFILLTFSSARTQGYQKGMKLVGIGAVGNAEQGRSVSIALNGNTAIVGGSGDNNGVGAVWIFSRSDKVWTQKAKLVGTGAVGISSQGISVSLSADGHTAIVGGSGDNGGAGAAWVFTQRNGVWTQQGNKLFVQGSVGNLIHLGVSVFLSRDGNTAIIGGDGDNGGQGAAWVFTRSEGVWTQQTKLVGTGASGNAFQGISVAISGSGKTVIVGGSGDNNGIGAAWVFAQIGRQWKQQAKLVGTGVLGSAAQGISVALSGDGSTAIVGGSGDKGNVGAAWIFVRSDSAWTQQGNKLFGTDAVGHAAQGISVALSNVGNMAIVGGYTDNSSRGTAWIFIRTDSAWTQRGNKLVGSGVQGSAYQGISVSVSVDGTTAIVGGFGDNGNTGAAWVYSLKNRINTIR